jgi:hypothetical protein
MAGMEQPSEKGQPSPGVGPTNELKGPQVDAGGGDPAIRIELRSSLKAEPLAVNAMALLGETYALYPEPERWPICVKRRGPGPDGEEWAAWAKRLRQWDPSRGKSWYTKESYEEETDFLLSNFSTLVTWCRNRWVILGGPSVYGFRGGNQNLVEEAAPPFDFPQNNRETRRAIKGLAQRDSLLPDDVAIMSMEDGENRLACFYNPSFSEFMRYGPMQSEFSWDRKCYVMPEACSHALDLRTFARGLCSLFFVKIYVQDRDGCRSIANLSRQTEPHPDWLLAEVDGKPYTQSREAVLRAIKQEGRSGTITALYVMADSGAGWEKVESTVSTRFGVILARTAEADGKPRYYCLEARTLNVVAMEYFKHRDEIISAYHAHVRAVLADRSVLMPSIVGHR